MSHHREVISALGAPEAAGPYSHAVKSGGLLFCSGQVHLDPQTGKLVEVIAAAGGGSLEDAVRMGIYVTDMSVFAEVNEAYAAFFQSGWPARSTVEVAALPLGARVEIDAVIALPG